VRSSASPPPRSLNEAGSEGNDVIDHYDWAGGREAMIRFGPTTGPVVIAAMPLFEEANRTRAFIVTMLRGLAERGIAGVLPDLPGMGESSIRTEEASLSNWKSAFSSVAHAVSTGTRSVHGMAVRGGALLDTEAALAGRWHFAPLPGENLVRDLLRTRLAAGDGGLDIGTIDPPGAPIELAGNRISPALLTDLKAAQPSAAVPLRTVRLDIDSQAADRHVPGAPLWRRSEPDNDPALAQLLADDIARWIATCGA
jgi:hypothetical protein